MKVFELQYKVRMSELDYLERIYKEVKLSETVKFNGKVYKRSTPKNNKFYKYPFHFHLAVSDIYKGNVLLKDDDGEFVNSICHYKLVVLGNS